MRDKLQEQGVRKQNYVTAKPNMARFDDLEKKVYNPESDEELGQIEDIIIDLANHRIAFGVLKFGDILGVGGKHYAIPWEKLEYDEESEHFHLTIDKEQLAGAEGFEPNEYPYSPYGPWAQGIYGYWGYPPYWP